MALQTDTLTIRGKKIQRLRGGGGKPLLYLHGLAADIHSLPATAGGRSGTRLQPGDVAHLNKGGHKPPLSM